MLAKIIIKITTITKYTKTITITILIVIIILLIIIIIIMIKKVKKCDGLMPNVLRKDVRYVVTSLHKYIHMCICII